MQLTLLSDASTTRLRKAVLSGPANPMWRGGRQPYPCEKRGKPVMRRASENGVRVFCGRKCFGDKRAPRGGKIKTACLACGADVARYRSQYRAKRVFCGRECKDGYGRVSIQCAWPGCTTEMAARVCDSKKHGRVYKVDLTKRGEYFKHPVCAHHLERFRTLYTGTHVQQTLNSFWKIVQGEKTPREGRGVSRMLAFIVWERQDGKCATPGCDASFAFADRRQRGVGGGGAWELDHVIPVFEGGRTELANLQALCRPCHDLKSREEKSRAAKNRHTRTAGAYRSTNYEKTQKITELVAEVSELKKAVVLLFALAAVRARHQ